MTTSAETGRIRLAVVTGGHSYDVPNFHALFRALPEVDACVQHMDDFASSSEEVRTGYDLVLFYTMMLDGPTDEGLPWYSGKPKTALEALGETDQGVVMLHHSLVAYRAWPRWREITGVAGGTFCDFKFDVPLHVEVTAAEHPITRGVAAFDVIDEIYDMDDADEEGNEVLLTVDYPKSMRTVAWTRTFRKSRVFCLQLGHDAKAWANPAFREVLSRGIAWCARRKLC